MEPLTACGESPAREKTAVNETIGFSQPSRALFAPVRTTVLQLQFVREQNCWSASKHASGTGLHGDCHNHHSSWRCGSRCSVPCVSPWDDDGAAIHGIRSLGDPDRCFDCPGVLGGRSWRSVRRSSFYQLQNRPHARLVQGELGPEIH
jgi:hypothetical protein